MPTTNIHEIADGVYRLSTCVPEVAPGGFTFNQFLCERARARAEAASGLIH